MSDDFADGFGSALIRVRADTRGFARDVAEMRSSLDGPLQAGAERAGRGIESALLRAVRTGKLEFEDLKRVALGVLDEIARAALRGGVDTVLGRGGGGLLGSLLGAPGRATGGPVSPARPYLVGERGPELFVPTASGRIEAGGANGFGGRARQVNIAIRVQAEAGAAPVALARSSRQVARAVRAALAEDA